MKYPRREERDEPPLSIVMTPSDDQAPEVTIREKASSLPLRQQQFSLSHTSLLLATSTPVQVPAPALRRQQCDRNPPPQFQVYVNWSDVSAKDVDPSQKAVALLAFIAINDVPQS